MSHNIWRYLLDDDVDNLRQYLANASFSSTAGKAAVSGSFGSHSFKIGSPIGLATSPRAVLKSRKSSGNTQNAQATQRAGSLVLNRTDVNGKDLFGRTVLHHAASSRSDKALDLVKTLLEIPVLDLYAQDAESGWTPLHRALYFGNVSVAQALLRRDIQDATDYTTNTSHSNAGGLVKIKDHEGNSPFEVFGLTIAPRTLQADTNNLSIGSGDNESTNSVDLSDNGEERDKQKHRVRPAVDLQGDEVFAFGSNKNLSLGLGDEDDRHFPERLQFRRPDHLMQRLLEDKKAERRKGSVCEDLANTETVAFSNQSLPTLIQNQALIIQDVVMSKLHTAVLTTDPISNLYICGFGPGGRLGTGDEYTAFNYKCIQGGGLAKRKVSSVALGQDHSIAISSQGEVFTWGSNRYGQLGYALPEASAKDTPIQVSPRQLYGNVKKEIIIGAAASSIHSAICTSSALYTFGKNAGQLGLMDADARSLEMQIIPRRVGVSVLQIGIKSVSAIDRATTVLLEDSEVIVFTHYGWTRLSFQMEGIKRSLASDAFNVRRHSEGDWIRKVTGGGNTVCAVSSLGEVFTVEVPGTSDGVPSNVSTTNPTKARNALPQPSRVWSIKKAHMSAIDAAVGQNGSIILCTAAGSVWRKEKRANIKQTDNKDPSVGRAKDYKFIRIPNLTRAVAVRSNAFGAFTAIRKDCDVMREQITVDPPALWDNVFALLSFREYGKPTEDEYSRTPRPRFWTPAVRSPDPSSIKRSIISIPGAENQLRDFCKRYEPLSDAEYDMWITSNVTDVRIPVHSFLIRARSKVLRTALIEFQEAYYFSIPDIVSIEYGQDGQIQVLFHGADFLTIANFVFYLYTDNVIDVWHYASREPRSAARYRSVRTELLKIANMLELNQLEWAVRVMTDPIKSLHNDMETAFLDFDFFADADVLIDLANDASLLAHSVLLSHRCPFFDGLFNGHAGGMWTSARRNTAEDTADRITVDLKHIEKITFGIVLRHLYADTGDELFDDVVTKTLEEFIDLVLDVMAAANELMIDRLAQICQRILGKFVTTRNISQLINTVAESSVNEFKYAGLEYICLNLESMLELRILDELDQDLLLELDATVQENQKAYMPFARSGRAEAELFDQHPDLANRIDQARQRRIDSMRLRSRLVDDDDKFSSSVKLRVGSLESQGPSLRNHRDFPSSPSKETSPAPSPAIRANSQNEDLPFDMDEDSGMLSNIDCKATASPEIGALEESSLEHSTRSLGSPTGSQVASPRHGIHYDDLNKDLTPSKPDISTSSSIRVSGFELPRAAWQSVPQTPKTTNLKDIMEQASEKRISGLTQAMQSAVGGSSKATPKMSQKERKRQMFVTKEPENEHLNTLNPSNESPSSIPPTPWQMMTAQRKASAGVEQSDLPTRAQERPNLTMRQTVAGSRSESNEAQPKIQRKVSSPAAGSSGPSGHPQIQSIRHTPLPDRSRLEVNARTSIADIVAQQQTEKTAIREATTAKRALIDIQQEQEFQAWWDSESRRVQEEEAQARATAHRPRLNTRGGSGKNRGRPGRKRRGSESTPVEEVASAASPPPSHHPLSRQPRGENRPGRGAGVRGRGGSRDAGRG